MLLIEPESYLNRDVYGRHPLAGSAFQLVTTMTTVGYGSVPQSAPGGMLSTLAAVLGLAQLYFLAQVFGKLLSFDEDEEKALATIDRSRAAAKAISESIKFKNEKKANAPSKINRARQNMETAIVNWRVVKEEQEMQIRRKQSKILRDHDAIRREAKNVADKMDVLAEGIHNAVY